MCNWFEYSLFLSTRYKLHDSFWSFINSTTLYDIYFLLILADWNFFSEYQKVLNYCRPNFKYFTNIFTVIKVLKNKLNPITMVLILVTYFVRQTYFFRPILLTDDISFQIISLFNYYKAYNYYLLVLVWNLSLSYEISHQT